MIYLDELVRATTANLVSAGARASFPAFAHDSRQVAPGECFVAVRGSHADGHDYLEDARTAGAGAVLIEARRQAALAQGQSSVLERLAEAGVAVLVVEDTRLAVQQYARYILAKWRPTVVAVTGATGKTTTKEAIAEVLALAKPTFRSWRNYNDLLGLPLSLGGLEPQHAFAVLEMACDHPGEIRALCAIAQPAVGVVTNVSPTHLQYFGSVAALAAELSQLPRALPPHGFAVLNVDDPVTAAMGADTGATVRYFGLVDAAASADEVDHRITVRYSPVPLAEGALPALTLRPHGASAQANESDVVMRHLHGAHWAGAALAALTVADALGVPLAEAARALTTFHPLPGRLNWLDGLDGSIVLDDSHNATPASALAGLDALAAVGAWRSAHARRIAVLGDMLRLGAEEEAAHRQVGRHAAETATHVVTFGPRAELIADEARRVGVPVDHLAVTRTPADAAQAVLDFARAAPEAGVGSDAPAGPGAVVLVKGSEEMRMERITALLLAHPQRAPDVLDRQSRAWQRVVTLRPDRPTWLEVDLGAIGQNTRQIKELVGPEVAVLVSLKADAYGHGALAVARTVLRNGAEWLGVATISEAVPLRAAGITAPMLVFGYIPPWQAREAVRLELRAAVYELESAQALAQAALDLGRDVRVHVKVDSGMGRLGLRAERVADVLAFFEALHSMPHLTVEGTFTQLATADSADRSYVQRQIDRFADVLAALDARGWRPPLVHAANSAATLTLPEVRYNLVRPGIAIYGLAPSAEVRLPTSFRPALAFKTLVAQVKEVPAGEGISYGATYVTRAPMCVATLPVGYADGFRRGPLNWGEVLVHGQRAPLLGRVTMDQCMVDVTHIPQVRIGDEVVLIGRQGSDELTAEAVAERLGTIHYEVVAELLARVPRIS